MIKVSLPRIAILGAGPIGIEAAIYARTLNFPVTVYEQGQPGEFVGRWGFARMFSPFGANTTSLGLEALAEERLDKNLPEPEDYLTGREFRDSYLSPLANTELLRGCFRPQSTVLSVGRWGWRKTDADNRSQSLPPFRILVREANNIEKFESADIVLDCLGTYARPNWLGDGGIPAIGELASRSQIPYWLEDVRGTKKANYLGKSIVLIGGGFSAATTMIELAELAEENQSTWVIWLNHGSRSAPLLRVANDPNRERDRIACKANSLATRCDGNLEYHPNAAIDEIQSLGQDQGFHLVGRLGQKKTTWDVEKVIANVGYRPDMTVCAELRVTEPQGEAITQEPGYFFLGSKSYGRHSNFFLQVGHQQIEQVFAQIARTYRLASHRAA